MKSLGMGCHTDRPDSSGPAGIGTSACELDACARAIALRYEAGHLPVSPANGMGVAWRYLLKDMRCHCPGFSDLQYGIALNQAFDHPAQTEDADR